MYYKMYLNIISYKKNVLALAYITKMHFKLYYRNNVSLNILQQIEHIKINTYRYLILYLGPHLYKIITKNK